MSIDIILSPLDLKHPPVAAVARGAFIAMGDAVDAVAALDSAQFDLVIFCAKEFPPPPQALADRARRGRNRAYHVALDDADLTSDEAFLAGVAANHAAQTFAGGGRVLVTCMQGKNRSGLVTALAHHILEGDGGAVAVRHVRERRTRLDSPALTNRSFVALLANLAPKHGSLIRRAG